MSVQARVASVIALVLVSAASAPAHDARPAYLQIDEVGPAQYAMIWRTPLLSGMRLPVVVRLPPDMRDVATPTVLELAGSVVERRRIAGASLAGRRIELAGLQGTITDVLVRVQLLDGRHSTTLVHPSQPWVEIAVARGPLAVAGAYLRHGIEHILFGYDHLLFVLALLLIVRSRRTLFLTISAFTIAHSITLTLATLDLVHVPVPPVEAAIALSIVLLAAEILRVRGGEASLTADRPWLVAFAFGLLHGLGFATALRDLGLPQGDVPLALLSFNAGVEVGQLAFVAGVSLVAVLADRSLRSETMRERLVPTTARAIGVVASFWFFERLAGFFA